jgi:ribosome-associated protein
MTDTNLKKNVTKLQKVVVGALEDVKAQDISVFNTEKLSPLFERVIIASGTSNRQTKALAANVRDDVREAGFGKPKIEGEENGEWIIVDCGPVVAHIMQPAIRQYYHLEEIWGEKPVRTKHGDDKMSQLVKEKAPKVEHTSKATGKTAAKANSKSTPSKSASTKASTAGAKRASPAGAKAGTKVATKAATKAAPKAATKTSSQAKPKVHKTSSESLKSTSGQAATKTARKTTSSASKAPAAKKKTKSTTRA